MAGRRSPGKPRPKDFSSRSPLLSKYSPFGVRGVIDYAPVAQARQLQRLEAPVRDQFGDGAAGRRRVHHAVTGKAAGDKKIRQCPCADDGVAIEFALLIKPRPGTHAAAGLEGRKAMRQRRPDDGLEVIVIDREVVAARLVGVDQAAGVTSETKVVPAGRVSAMVAVTAGSGPALLAAIV